MNACTLWPDKWEIHGILYDLYSACALHDERYADKEITRKEADAELWENIIMEIGCENKWLADLTYFGVRTFGWFWWWSGLS